MDRDDMKLVFELMAVWLVTIWAIVGFIALGIMWGGGFIMATIVTSIVLVIGAVAWTTLRIE